MSPWIQEIHTAHTALSLASALPRERGLMVLHSGTREAGARYSLVTTRPFLTLRTFGARCEMETAQGPRTQFGNPWAILDQLLTRYELSEDTPTPFPLGGCFGFWGYDLKNFVEPKLRPRAVNDLEWPDCQVGLYDSLVAFEEGTTKAWIIATGLDADGERQTAQARHQMDFWQHRLRQPVAPFDTAHAPSAVSTGPLPPPRPESNFTRDGFVQAVQRAQHYIRQGDIYQVNLAQRLSVEWAGTGWDLFLRLVKASPAPHAAYLHAGDFEIASSSPELFLRISGSHIQTRPIKGTRPRSQDPHRDAALAAELLQSAKERSELIMITDLLRNDLGKVCSYGSVRVPDLLRLEPYAQVQHLVSTVEGELRPGVAHFEALASTFPGGSITGAPKFRAMEIIDELEPVTRGPYTGCLGYLGFNRRCQLNMLIRTALCRAGRAWWHVGAGIVADSDAEAEYEETLAKSRGLDTALGLLEIRSMRHAS